jgi:hypothetical protein
MLCQQGRLMDRELTPNKGLSLFSNISPLALLSSGYRYTRPNNHWYIGSAMLGMGEHWDEYGYCLSP